MVSPASPLNTAPEITIESLRDEAETRLCATLMVNSEPWITLKRGFDKALALFQDKTRELYIARVEGTFAGFILVNMQGPFPGYIQVLAVAPEFRSRGIGTKLVRFAEERIFRDSPNVFLCVSSFNPRAQKLYARLGYERIGELKDYIITGASEFLMRKTTGPWTGFKK